MKLRPGFVSNSSSSSFVIPLRVLSAKQVSMIKSHADSEGCENYDAWDITENEFSVDGSTSMDNFDMHYFLTHLVGVDSNDIEWSD